jgi:hypothetical protein
MYFEQIPNTCSMVELCNVAKSDLENITKTSILSCFDNWDDDEEKIKVIIYNTNYKEDDRAKLKAIGFEEVFEYEGNEDITYTMMLKI